MQVLDRGKRVARLTGIGDATVSSGEEQRQRLVQAGLGRPGTTNTSRVLEQAPPELSADLRLAVDEDRNHAL